MQTYLKGAYDLHLHTNPDRVARKLSDGEMAERAVTRGMAGFVIKNHHEDTSLRAAEICRAFPQLLVAGGITLNNSVGGIHAEAVEKAANQGARFVWFPTVDALHASRFYGKDTAGKISILTDGGIIHEAHEVLEVVKQHNLILSTGHISPAEALALVKAARERSVEKIILTHADFPSVFTDSSQQLAFVRLGAVIEHSSLSLEMNKTPWEVMAEQIRTVGCEHVVLSSDLGQPENPYPDESLHCFAEGLHQRGFTLGEIEQMIKSTPGRLLQS